MAGSSDCSHASPGAALDAALARWHDRRRRHVVAFSGGSDSSLLLAMLAQRLPRRRLQAIHVHHGWHAEADAWAAHCRQAAGRLGIDCRVEQVDSRDARGEGPEAAARAARYAAIRGHLQPGMVLWTAHHADDQAETLLLALLRGGGTRGAAAMPAWRRLAPGFHVRPWLQVPRAALLAEVERRGLECLRDPANADPRFDRAYLRHQVLPALRTRWPGAVATLARAAGRFASDAGLQADLAAVDYAHCRGQVDGTLDCAALLQLARPRQENLVRWWLARQYLPTPPARRLAELLTQLAMAAGDRNPAIAWPGAEVRRWHGLVWALPARAEVDPSRVFDWPDPARPLALPDRRLSAEELPDPAILEGGRVRVCYRRGGERIRLPGWRRSRALKDWLVALGVPPWERERLPLIFVDGELVATGRPRWRARKGR